MDQKALSRFENSYIPEPNSGCWIWIAVCSHFGHGEFILKKKYAAHRFSWILHKGEIPKGLCVLHACDVPACVNPQHLFLGTRGDNNTDRAKKGRSYLSKLTHCHRGHPLSGENLMPHKPTKRRPVTRRCKECWKIRKYG
jgi:hypothetical protein